MAAREGNQAMCELLVTSGAHKDVLNADGKSPSQIAQTHGHERIALYLLTH
jgi:ankyrin repeat protein